MDLERLTGWTVYPRSMVETDGSTYFLARGEGGEKRLAILGDAAGFGGTRHEQSGSLLCPLSPANAAALRARLPWLCPVPLGLRTSVGCGDRLGLATPGHVRAATTAGFALTPVFSPPSGTIDLYRMDEEPSS